VEEIKNRFATSSRGVLIKLIILSFSPSTLSFIVMSVQAFKNERRKFFEEECKKEGAIVISVSSILHPRMKDKTSNCNRFHDKNACFVGKSIIENSKIKLIDGILTYDDLFACQEYFKNGEEICKLRYIYKY